MKRSVIQILCIVAITLLAAGCGSRDQTSSVKDTSAVRPKEAVSAETQAPTKEGAAVETTAEKEANASESSASQADNSQTVLLTEEDAMTLALSKVPGAAESDVRIHRDYDDGRTIYEGSIIYDNIEYDFEIDANSGKIVEWEEEYH